MSKTGEFDKQPGMEKSENDSGDDDTNVPKSPGVNARSDTRGMPKIGKYPMFSKEAKENTSFNLEAKDALTYAYAVDCGISVGNDKKISLSWNNGNALKATRGAAIDFIPEGMFIHYTAEHYAFMDDLIAMREHLKNEFLALIVCLMRKVICSSGEVILNLGESVRITREAGDATLSEDTINKLKVNSASINVIVQQSFTILALNGIGLITTGHHYTDSQTFWTKMNDATGILDVMTQVGLANKEAVVFREAFHVFDYDWVAQLVTTMPEQLAKHVNGVALKRLYTLPAGTTALGLIHPLYELCNSKNGKLGNLLRPITLAANKMITQVKEAPLDYCTHFPRSRTAHNLQQIGKYTIFVAFMSGYLKKLNVKKSTALAAKSLGNIIDNNRPAFEAGEKAAAIFTEEEASPDEIWNLLSSYASALGVEIPDLESDDDSSDNEMPENAANLDEENAKESTKPFKDRKKER